MAVLSPQASAPSGATESQKGAIAPNPFTKAAKRRVEPFLDVSRPLTASGQTLQQVDIPATGYLRHVVLDVELSGFTAGVYLDDAPFSVLSSVSLTDVNSSPIVLGSGYELYLANLVGGYTQHGDVTQAPLYSKTATGARFQLRVPVEIVQRNALGALPNLNAAMTYKLKVNLAPQLEVLSAATGTVNVRIRAHVESWSSPQGADATGRPNVTTPPALGTTQNWSTQTTPTSTGQNTLRIARVGNTIRNIVFIHRNASGVRTDAGLPEELTLLIDGNQWLRTSFSYLRQRMFELYGWTNAQRPAGVWVIPMTDDFDGTPGEEMGEYWLETSGATRLELQGSFTAGGGSLAFLINDIIANATAPTSGPGQTLGA